MLTLETLLLRCGIGLYMEGIWFRGARLRGNVLSVQDDMAARFIGRCWGSQMREHIPELRIVVESQPVIDKPKVERKSPWKAGKEPSKARLGGME